MPDTQSTSPIFWVDSQIDLVTAVVDQLIPPAEGFPGAGEVEVVGYLDRVVGKAVGLRRLFGQGMAQVQIVAQAQFQADFVALDQDKKGKVLQEVETKEPAFFDALVQQTYNGYYTHPRVKALLGEDARPPQPKGYALEGGDFGGLEAVKGRGRIYREV